MAPSPEVVRTNVISTYSPYKCMFYSCENEDRKDCQNVSRLPPLLMGEEDNTNSSEWVPAGGDKAGKRQTLVHLKD